MTQEEENGQTTDKQGKVMGLATSKKWTALTNGATGNDRQHGKKESKIRTSTE